MDFFVSQEFSQIFCNVFFTELKHKLIQNIGLGIAIVGVKIIKFLIPFLILLVYFYFGIDHLLVELNNGIMTIDSKLVFSILFHCSKLILIVGISSYYIYIFMGYIFKKGVNINFNFNFNYFIETIDFMLNIVFTCITVFFLNLATINIDFIKLQINFVENKSFDIIKTSIALFTLYYLPLKLTVMIIKYFRDYIFKKDYIIKI